MKTHPLIYPSFNFLVAGAAAANNMDGIPSLTMQEYLLIFILAIVYMMIFMIVVDRIFRIHFAPRIKGRNLAVITLEYLIAFVLVTMGNLLIISSVIIVIAFAMKLEALLWIVEVFRMNLVSPVLELAILSGAGLIFYMVGIYILARLQGTPSIDRRGMPEKSAPHSKYSIDLMDEEPLNPSLTFKVLDRESDEPIPDVKVILKQMNGTRFYEKYTDFNGEVTFQKIEGYGSEYYAYVEGDEKREKYRVIRRGVSAEI